MIHCFRLSARAASQTTTKLTLPSKWKPYTSTVNVWCFEQEHFCRSESVWGVCLFSTSSNGIRSHMSSGFEKFAFLGRLESGACFFNFSIARCYVKISRYPRLFTALCAMSRIVARAHLVHLSLSRAEACLLVINYLLFGIRVTSAVFGLRGRQGSRMSRALCIGPMLVHIVPAVDIQWNLFLCARRWWLVTLTFR